MDEQRPLRLKIITNKGINFYMCIESHKTICDLAQRALNCYIQLRKEFDGTFSPKLRQLTVSGVRYHDYYLAKSQVVGHLLEFDDEVQCLISKAKPNYPKQPKIIKNIEKILQQQEQSMLQQKQKVIKAFDQPKDNQDDRSEVKNSKSGKRKQIHKQKKKNKKKKRFNIPQEEVKNDRMDEQIQEQQIEEPVLIENFLGTQIDKSNKQTNKKNVNEEQKKQKQNKKFKKKQPKQNEALMPIRKGSSQEKPAKQNMPSPKIKFHASPLIPSAPSPKRKLSQKMEANQARQKSEIPPEFKLDAADPAQMQQKSQPPKTFHTEIREQSESQQESEKKPQSLHQEGKQRMADLDAMLDKYQLGSESDQ